MQKAHIYRKIIFPYTTIRKENRKKLYFDLFIIYFVLNNKNREL